MNHKVSHKISMNMCASVKSALLVTVIFLCACGWQLRGGNQPFVARDIHLLAADRYAPLTLLLMETMQQRGISNNDKAILFLRLGNEKLSKHTVAVTSIGSPSQYELTLSVDYLYFYSRQQQTMQLAKTYSVVRAFDFDPSNTVAKNEEENTLLEEMRRELSHKILQQIPDLSDHVKTQL